MRRRPLLRAAAVGGAAYYGGKRSAQRSQAEADQNARLNDLEEQQYAVPQQAPPPPPAYAPPPAPAYAAPAPPAASGAPSGIAAQLEQLAALRQQGALTDEEFSAAKARLLA